MFDYDNYKIEYDKIADEQNKCINDWVSSEDSELSRKIFRDKSRICRYKALTLNRKYGIIFKHKLSNAWHLFKSQIIIADSKTDNVVIVNADEECPRISTISDTDIKKIKDLLFECESVFDDIRIPSPPVFDGTIHNIYFAGENRSKEMQCSNLWFWLDSANIDNHIADTSSETREYTKKIICLFKGLQKILDDNKIKFTLLED